MIYILFF